MVAHYIQDKCGTMRVLDMNQLIGLNDIYTNVNILDTIARNGRLNSLLSNFCAIINI